MTTPSKPDCYIVLWWKVTPVTFDSIFVSILGKLQEGEANICGSLYEDHDAAILRAEEMRNQGFHVSLRPMTINRRK